MKQDKWEMPSTAEIITTTSCRPKLDITTGTTPTMVPYYMLLKGILYGYGARTS